MTTIDVQVIVSSLLLAFPGWVRMARGGSPRPHPALALHTLADRIFYAQERSLVIIFLAEAAEIRPAAAPSRYGVTASCLRWLYAAGGTAVSFSPGPSHRICGAPWLTECSPSTCSVCLPARSPSEPRL